MITKYCKKAIVMVLMVVLCFGLTGCKREEEITAEENLADTITELEDDENSDFYQICTNYSKLEVESFALNVKQMFSEKAWSEMGEYVSYPITIGNVICENKEAFAEGEFESELTEDFYKAIEEETCIDMFCSWRGIMFSDGEVWIGEVIDEATGEGELKIIAIKGKNAQPEKVEITKG